MHRMKHVKAYMYDLMKLQVNIGALLVLLETLNMVSGMIQE